MCRWHKTRGLRRASLRLGFKAELKGCAWGSASVLGEKGGHSWSEVAIFNHYYLFALFIEKKAKGEQQQAQDK